MRGLTTDRLIQLLVGAILILTLLAGCVVAMFLLIGTMTVGFSVVKGIWMTL